MGLRLDEKRDDSVIMYKQQVGPSFYQLGSHIIDKLNEPIEVIRRNYEKGEVDSDNSPTSHPQEEVE